MRKEITTLIENGFVELPGWKINLPREKVSFIARTQKEGERELVEISRIAKTEDAWIHFKESEIWIHPVTKYSTEIVDDGSTLHKIESYSLKLPGEMDNLEKQINYHLHPWKVFFEAYKSFSREKPQLGKLFKNLLCSWLALPSGFDLKQTLFCSEERKIASPFGITSYRLYSGEPPPQLYYLRKPTQIDGEILSKKGFEKYISFLTDEIRKKLPDVHFDLSFERVRIKQ